MFAEGIKVDQVKMYEKVYLRTMERRLFRIEIRQGCEEAGS